MKYICCGFLVITDELRTWIILSHVVHHFKLNKHHQNTTKFLSLSLLYLFLDKKNWHSFDLSTQQTRWMRPLALNETSFVHILVLYNSVHSTIKLSKYLTWICDKFAYFVCLAQNSVCWSPAVWCKILETDTFYRRRRTYVYHDWCKQLLPLCCI